MPSDLRKKAREIVSASDTTKTVMQEKTTVVCARLPNGYEVVGTSAPVDPEQFDPEVGSRVAMSEVIDQVESLLAANAHGPLTQPE
jgi:hypothetical protein